MLSKFSQARIYNEWGHELNIFCREALFKDMIYFNFEQSWKNVNVKTLKIQTVYIYIFTKNLNVWFAVNQICEILGILFAKSVIRTRIGIGFNSNPNWTRKFHFKSTESDLLQPKSYLNLKYLNPKPNWKKSNTIF